MHTWKIGIFPELIYYLKVVLGQEGIEHSSPCINYNCLNTLWKLGYILGKLCIWHFPRKFEQISAGECNNNKKLLAQTKLLGIIQNQEANALWSNTIIAADAKEFVVIMQSSLYSQIKCLNLDEMNALQPVQSIEENRKFIFLKIFNTNIL